MSEEIKFTSEITVRLVQQCGGDAMVVAAARVSTSGEDALKWVNTPAEDNYGLINFLMKHRHGSVFEHSFLTFFVHAPIFVFREWHRHRIGHSFNETSGRYSEMKPVFWLPRGSRKMVPAPDHKSARPKFVESNDKQYDICLTEMQEAYKKCWWSYRQMLYQNIAKEVARAVLPVGIYSSCWVSVNPRSLMHFLSLRTHEPTAKHVSYPQAEIAEAARQCEEMFKQGWALTHKAFVENGRVAP